MVVEKRMIEYFENAVVFISKINQKCSFSNPVLLFLTRTKLGF